jgi:plasmid stabilization system protein ParE
MTYHVITEPTAEAEIERAYAWRAERSSVAAARWVNGLLEAIASLSEYPERWPLAPEAATFGLELRQRLYGKRRSVYRIMFYVEGNNVHVTNVRHAAQKDIEPGEAGW